MNGYTRVNGAAREFPEGEMRAAFEAVQSKNWKDPIAATIDAEELCVTAAAIEFFAGSEMYIKALGDHKFHIKAPGYYARVGA